MIPIPSGVTVWIATGHTDMRRGMQGLALTVQEQLKRDPHAGDLMKPGPSAARSREHLNPLRGPGASIVTCDHSKPSGSNQPAGSQITKSFGR
jgi:hypothetical protein